MNSVTSGTRDASYTTYLRRIRASRAIHTQFATRTLQVPSQDSIRTGLTAQEVVELRLGACACSCNEVQCGGTRLSGFPACSGC